MPRSSSLAPATNGHRAAFGAAALLCALSSAPDAQHGHGEARTSDESPAELFAGRCLGCHVPPDPRFAVERAWLEQVLDTA